MNDMAVNWTLSNKLYEIIFRIHKMLGKIFSSVISFIMFICVISDGKVQIHINHLLCQKKTLILWISLACCHGKHNKKEECLINTMQCTVAVCQHRLGKSCCSVLNLRSTIFLLLLLSSFWESHKLFMLCCVFFCFDSALFKLIRSDDTYVSELNHHWFNSLRRSDAYIRQYTSHHWCR